MKDQGIRFQVRSKNCEKQTISFVVCLSLHPSVGIEQLGSIWTDFNEILLFSIFKKSVQKIQVSLKSVKNNRYFT